jgi:hypothetical protein
MFGGKAGALMNEEPFKSSTLRYKLLDFPTNIRLGWQYLPETNTLAYYENP